MILLGGPDESLWKIGTGSDFQDRLRELSDEDLQTVLAEVEKILWKSKRAHRRVLQEVARRKEGRL